MDLEALLILLAIVFVAGVMVGYGIRSLYPRLDKTKLGENELGRVRK